MYSNSFKNKKVFITGHTGFKGSWFVLLLHQLGAKIKGYSIDVPHGGIFTSVGVQDYCEHSQGDVCNYDFLKKEILTWQPDFVFHLAAQPLVLHSYKDPVSTFQVNALGTVNLLDALRELSKPCITLIITTDKVYENKEWPYPYRETDSLGGADPYSASKAMAELAVSSYRLSFFNPLHYAAHNKSIASVRAGNVIGGGDVSENRIIPDIVKSLVSNKSISLRNPNAIRPWQHVLEALCGYLHLAAAMAKKPDDATLCSAWNLGPHESDTLSVETLTKLAIESWRDGQYVIESANPTYKETSVLQLSIAKAKSLLGWQPLWFSQEAVAKTIAWYQHSYKHPTTIKEFTFHQINEYLHENRYTRS